MLEIEVPERWYAMTDKEIHAWKVQRAKEKGEPPPLTMQEASERLGRQMAERRESVVLKTLAAL